MATTAEKTEIQLQLTLPATLLKQLDAAIPPDQRNQFFAELLERELRRRNFRRAWTQAAGAWSAEDHPDLETAEDIEAYVRRIRETWLPRSGDGPIPESQHD